MINRKKIYKDRIYLSGNGRNKMAGRSLTSCLASSKESSVYIKHLKQFKMSGHFDQYRRINK